MTNAKLTHTVLQHAGDLVEMAGSMLHDIGEQELAKTADMLRRQIGDTRHRAFLRTLASPSGQHHSLARASGTGQGRL